ncbi:hypothetical protein DFH08DRAFT_796985 [Mycena albidolilacea]|uniref:Uncharacterized protein n=1 Tax=Mycena albidolilacea TaxID=1033008 RepID=A0AAD7AW75_9AGAR|nr:hypothetical protein DFH08DRAFT_796985 [Mycena albidolilacea]
MPDFAVACTVGRVVSVVQHQKEGGKEEREIREGEEGEERREGGIRSGRVGSGGEGMRMSEGSQVESGKEERSRKAAEGREARSRPVTSEGVRGRRKETTHLQQPKSASPPTQYIRPPQGPGYRISRAESASAAVILQSPAASAARRRSDSHSPSLHVRPEKKKSSLYPPGQRPTCPDVAARKSRTPPSNLSIRHDASRPSTVHAPKERCIPSRPAPLSTTPLTEAGRKKEKPKGGEGICARKDEARAKQAPPSPKARSTKAQKKRKKKETRKRKEKVGPPVEKQVKDARLTCANAPVAAPALAKLSTAYPALFPPVPLEFAFAAFDKNPPLPPLPPKLLLSVVETRLSRPWRKEAEKHPRREQRDWIAESRQQGIRLEERKGGWRRKANLSDEAIAGSEQGPRGLFGWIAASHGSSAERRQPSLLVLRPSADPVPLPRSCRLQLIFFCGPAVLFSCGNFLFVSAARGRRHARAVDVDVDPPPLQVWLTSWPTSWSEVLESCIFKPRESSGCRSEVYTAHEDPDRIQRKPLFLAIGRAGLQTSFESYLVPRVAVSGLS